MFMTQFVHNSSIENTPTNFRARKEIILTSLSKKDVPKSCYGCTVYLKIWFV